MIPLKYAKPSELAPVLQPFAKLPTSILPIDGSQILVLRDYAENVKRMLEMIKQIDISVPSEFLSEVIPIKYAKASDISDALNSLSSGGGGATSVGRAATGPGRSAFTSGFGRSGGIGGGAGGNSAYGAQAATPGAVPGQPAAAAPAPQVSRTGCAISSRAPRVRAICRSSARQKSLPMSAPTRS